MVIALMFLFVDSISVLIDVFVGVLPKGTYTNNKHRFMNFTPQFRKKRLRVLVVDDDPIFRMIVNKHLLHLKEQYSRMGTLFDYVITENSREGLNSFDDEADVVVLDYGLDADDDQDVTGLDILLELRAINPAVKVLMISGQKNPLIREVLLDHGASDYIQKGTNTMPQLINFLNENFTGKALVY